MGKGEEGWCKECGTACCQLGDSAGEDIAECRGGKGCEV